MPQPPALLTSQIIDYCGRCTPDERMAIVAYCCHLAFSDKSIRRQEVDFVEAIANQMEVSAHDVRKMARKARRRRLKIKTPKSRAARSLLFHLAMRTAMADTRADLRERKALEYLCHQLRISPNVFEHELNKLQQKIIPPREAPALGSEALGSEASTRKSARGDDGEHGVIESLAQNMVAEHLTAKLTCPAIPPTSPEAAELAYTLSHDGDIELEIHGPDLHLPAGEKLSIFIAGIEVCAFTSPLPPHLQPIKVKRETCRQQFTQGATVTIKHQKSILFSGALTQMG